MRLFVILNFVSQELWQARSICNQKTAIGAVWGQTLKHYTFNDVFWTLGRDLFYGFSVLLENLGVQ